MPASGDLDLRCQAVEQPKRQVDGLTLVLGQLDRRQPGPAARPERVAPWTGHEVADEDGADPVAEPRPLGDEDGPRGDPPTEGPGRRIRLPDRRQVVRGEELGEGRRVDRVGLHLGVRDGPRPERVRHDDPAGVALEELDDRPRVRRRLEDDLVGRSERRGERLEALW
jgi:hypothetical protein